MLLIVRLEMVHSPPSKVPLNGVLVVPIGSHSMPDRAMLLVRDTVLFSKVSAVLPSAPRTKLEKPSSSAALEISKLSALPSPYHV